VNRRNPAISLLANLILHDQPIKLLGIFDEHKMLAAFCFFEDFELRTFDLTMNPFLRLPRHRACSTADDEGGKVDPRDDISSVRMAQIVQ
jgi:hypothetical protein